MPKEPELPEDGPEYRREVRRIVRPWAWTGSAIASAGIAALIFFAYRDSPRGGSAGMTAAAVAIGVGIALELVGIVKRHRFHKAFIASHPIE